MIIEKFEYPWDEAPEWARWAATDEQGLRFWFESEPTAHPEHGTFWSDEYHEAIGDIENWQNSLQERPRPKWEPRPGMNCAFWNHDTTEETRASVYAENLIHGDYPHETKRGLIFKHCAELKTKDEIEKPASYFIERGDWV